VSGRVDIESVPTAGTKRLPPAPRSLEALGRHHSLEAALAELVDNSIDAGAKHVLIRFVEVKGSLQQLVVVDDGRGMSDAEVDVAMTVGGEREYDEHQIGRFGFGMKAASFSQANVMTVLSRSGSDAPVGRRWRLEHAKRDFECEIIAREYAAQALNADWDLPSGSSGTIITWDDVKGFPAHVSEGETQRFLQDAFARIRTHLGIIYHRLLARQAVRIYVDMADADEGLGQRLEVHAIDPFAHPRTGVPGWPRELLVSEGLKLRCHIWPGRSTLEEFRLDGNLVARQGFYVYYQDRLIQRGGWNGLLHADKQLNLARAAIDIAGDVPGILALKPEKNGIEPGPRFAPVVRAATANGISFGDWVDAARSTLKESNRRKRTRAARLPPGSGFDPRLRRSIEREIPMKHEEPLSIRWAPLGTTEFFFVDREEAVLWLNKRYRPALLGDRAGSLNDLPVVKVLLYLLFEEVFSGQNIGPRDRDNLDLWQELLTAAAEAEARD
jgi:Histidine kinase-, DNA gyrase B-, and HSP90-like ATPase